VERHLRVAEQTKHEIPAGEDDPLGVDLDLMLLPFADDSKVGPPVLGVPVGILLAHPVDHGLPTGLVSSHPSIDPRLGDSRVVETIQIGVTDKEHVLSTNLVNLRVMHGRNVSQL
jgi:hypothetical protein